MPGRTQEALYADIDLELSWSESQLPQVERTKHVHALHPYLGKYVPQLVETFLRRYFKAGDTIYDPFVGSGTTLVESNVFGAHAYGCDISAFNCLLSQVKTTTYGLASLGTALEVALEETRQAGPVDTPGRSPWLETWYSSHALGELLGLTDRRVDELGAAEEGTSRRAIDRYVDGIVEVLGNARTQLEGRGPIIIVVNDSRQLYPEILSRAALTLEERLTRHVNRRTGRRAGEFYEDMLICVADG